MKVQMKLRQAVNESTAVRGLAQLRQALNQQSSVVAQRIINLFQSIEVGIEDHRYPFVAANGRQVLLSHCQETAPVVETGQCIPDRLRSQRLPQLYIRNGQAHLAGERGLERKIGGL